jgi:hypothetical protein
MNNDDRLTALQEAAKHVCFARGDGQDPAVLLAELGEPVPSYLARLPPYLLWCRVEVVLAEQWPALDHAACWPKRGGLEVVMSAGR